MAKSMKVAQKETTRQLVSCLVVFHWKTLPLGVVSAAEGVVGPERVVIFRPGLLWEVPDALDVLDLLEIAHLRLHPVGREPDQ